MSDSDDDLNGYSQESIDAFFAKQLVLAESAAELLGESSTAYMALAAMKERNAQGLDYVVMLFGDQWIVGPRPVQKS